MIPYRDINFERDNYYLQHPWSIPIYVGPIIIIILYNYFV